MHDGPCKATGLQRSNPTRHNQKPRLAAVSLISECRHREQLGSANDPAVTEAEIEQNVVACMLNYTSSLRGCGSTTNQNASCCLSLSLPEVVVLLESS